jgi:alpha/beta superfamily hydrolase
MTSEPLSAAVEPSGELVDVRANTVLVADRRPVTLETSDGLRLVGELALPVNRPVAGTAVFLHPLPTHGGSMDSHVLRKAAWRLPALAGIAVLRFNTRGTTSVEGTSEGEFGGGDSERFDVAAALDLVDAADSEVGVALPRPWLVGWSFGTELALRYGAEEPSVAGAILLAPPLHRAGGAELETWARSGKPLVALVPELDDYLRPPEAEPQFAKVPQTRFVALAGCKHLFVGFAEEALDEIAATIVPGSAPLPQQVPSSLVQGSAPPPWPVTKP